MQKPRYVSQLCYRCGNHAGWILSTIEHSNSAVCHSCVASEHALLLHFKQATRATPIDEYLSTEAAALYWQRQQECLNVGSNLRALEVAMANNTELDFQLSIDYTET